MLLFDLIKLHIKWQELKRKYVRIQSTRIQTLQKCMFWVKGRKRKKIFCNNLEGILSSYLAAPFRAVVLLRQSQDA